MEAPRSEKANICQWPASACLITALADHLAQAGERDLRKVTVLVPTLRLGTYLRAALAKRLTIVLPPKIMTLERWLKQLPVEEQIEQTPLGKLGAQLLLGKLIEEGGYRFVRPSHDHELLQLFQDISTSLVSSTPFKDLSLKLDEDIYRDESGIASLQERVAEIEHLHQAFQSTIKQKQWCLANEQLAQRAQWVSQDWGPNEGESMYLVGFTSVLPQMRSVLQTLAASQQTQVWVSAPPTLLGAVNPLQELISLFPAHRHTHVNTDRGRGTSEMPQQKRAPQKRILAANSPLDEVKWAVAHLRSRLSQGTPASRLAVIVPNEPCYDDLLRSELKHFAIPCNIAISRSFQKTKLGSWLQNLNAFLEGDQTSICFAGWLLHPLTKLLLKGNSEEEDLLSEEVYSRFFDLLRKKNISHGAFLIQKACESSGYGQLLALWQAWLSPLLSNQKRTPYEWSLSLDEAYRTHHIWEIVDALEQEPGVKESCQDVWQQWCDTALQLKDDETDSVNGRRFFAHMMRHLSKQEVRPVGEPLAGVQVISIPEARYFPFSEAIILGCIEGNFPKALPKDELLDDYLKRLLGLPGWRALEAREDLTFNLLKERLPSLIFTYPTQSLGEPLVRSRFIEQLQWEYQTQVEEVSFDSVEPKRAGATAKIAPKEGVLQEPTPELLSEFSATSLAYLISCPYRFLLHRMGLKEFDLPSIKADSRLEGEWLHQVVADFFGFWPKVQPDTLTEFQKQAVATLDALTLKNGPKDVQNSPLHLHLKTFSWPRFAEHLWGLFKEDWSAAKKGQREFAFQASSDILPQQTTSLVGKVDAIDRLGQGGFVITDYKRKHLPHSKDVAFGINPQLGFYALALDAQGVLPQEGMVVGYWSILDGKWLGISSGEVPFEHATKASLIKKNAPPLSQLISQLKELWRARLADIARKGQRYYADSTDCTHCPYVGVCRRDDPRYQEAFEEQAQLERWASGQEALS